MTEFEMTPQSAFSPTATATAERVTAFLKKVYGWMFVGLGVTAAVAWVWPGSPSLMQTFFEARSSSSVSSSAELGLVFYLSARVERSSRLRRRRCCSLSTPALNGLLFPYIFLAYTKTSIATTFLVAAGMFGALALYGSTTKRSLAGVGQFVFMGLIGLILASLVGMFVKSDGLQFVISIVGVIVFTGLTAWDAQRLKAMATALPEGQTGSYAVVGALSLYLDFINLFLFMLRFFGRRD